MSTVLQDFTYAYDANGNAVSEEDRNGDVTTFGYDALDRLTSFDTASDPAVAYGYDLAGNRVQAGSKTFNFDALNRLQASSDGRTFDYDDAGRLSEVSGSGATKTYTYDALDQMRQVDIGSSTSIAYDFDALGRRTARDDGSSVTNAHYSGFSSAPTINTDASSQITSSAVFGPSGLLQERAASTTAYPLSDRHGDVTTVSDASGTVASRHAYDPWGEVTSGTEPEFGYLGTFGIRTDTETDATQMGIRSYEPGLGAFTSEDPVVGQVGNGAAASRYQHAFANPGNVYDLSGAFPSRSVPIGFAASVSATSQSSFESLSYASSIAKRSPQAKDACSAESDSGFFTDFGHAVVGWGDSYSFGLTAKIREEVVGNNGNVDPCNEWMGKGELLAAASPGFGGKANLASRGANAVVDASRHTPDQQALREIVDEATNAGRKPLPREDAETVLDWADEVDVASRAKRGDVSSPSNWRANPVPHIHIPGAGRGGHVPVEPGVGPRD